MIALRTPVSLRHLFVAGGQRKRCIGGDRKRGRAQRRHFTGALESLWRHSPHPRCSPAPAAAAARRQSNSSWQPLVLENTAFEEYYKVSDEYGEDFISPLTWYPGNLAWRLNFSRKQLRKTEALESFHEFLKHESEVGNITRQEAVSMVPPLFLNVQPDHHILDMCAAPGSKTFQLLEIIHQSKEPGLLPRALVIANDFKAQRCDLLIHNTKRMCTANLIVTNHDAQNFPSCSLAKDHSETDKDHHIPQRVTICALSRNSSMGNEFHLLQVNIAMRGIALLKVGGRMVYSTCSMNPIENEAVVAELLWRSGNSVELLDVSKELPELVRRSGLSTWKVNDRGSWCQTHEDVSHDRKNVILPSMFPSSKSTHEGHAVYNNVDAKLEYSMSFSRNFKIEEMSNVNCDTGGVSTSISTQSSDYTSNSVGSKSPLSRCMRIVPHDQDGGAFFIAVIHKLSPLNESQMTDVGKTEHPLSTARTVGLQEQYQPEITTPVKKMMHQHGIVSEVRGDNKLPVEQKNLSVDNQTSKHNKLIEVKMETDDVKYSQTKSGDISHRTKKLDCQYKWKGIDPVLFFEDDAVIKNIVSFFGIEETFSLEGRLVTRSTDNARRIYYISKSVQEILELNVQVGEQIKIASVGVKMFERHRSKDGCSCAYRLSYEGLSLLFPYMRKRILYASPVDFQQLLQCRTINFAHFTDARFGEDASSLMPGCCVVVLREGHQDADSVAMDPSTIAIVCWRGKSTMNVLVSPPDRKELLEYRFGFKEFKVEDEKPNKDINGLDEGN
ncbi:hypothetical protein ACQ4PT_021521 [Festuca glaucescens]